MQDNMTSDQTLTFSSLGLSEQLLSALDEMGFTNPTPIQAESIPHLLKGSDLLGKAQTGTGKTAAFGLPLLNKIDIKQHAPQAIIMAPTRELAIQVAAEIKQLGRHINGLKVLEIYGGASIGDQMRGLRQGVHIVVGTPGRVKDLLTRKNLDLAAANTFILDEADEMLKMGFVDDVTWILEQAPESAQRILFSATMPPMVRQIVDRYLRSPIRIDVAGANHTVEQVIQQYWVVRGVEKDEALSRLLETETTDASIVFVRTKQDTERLADWLSARGFKALALHGDIPQSLRERCIDHIKRGVVDVLVATDVVARGLDVPRITHVFNYDIPFDAESYIHRIGRTGRAGRAGKAVLLVRNNQIRMLRTIERVTHSKMEEIDLPLRDQVAKARLHKLSVELEASKEEHQLPRFIELIEQLQQQLAIDVTQLAAILLQRQQGKRPLFYTGPDPLLNPKADRTRDRSERGGDKGFDRNRGERSRSDRDRGSDRSERSERPPREQFFGNQADWDTYALKVGRSNGVEVRDIVGAIANEVGFEKRSIGAIKLTPEYTYVQLPKDMAKTQLQKLQQLKIRQRDTMAQVTTENVFREQQRSGSDQPKGNGGGYRDSSRGDQPRRESNRSEGGRSDSSKREKVTFTPNRERAPAKRRV